jgi:hypothetical protein
VSALQQNASKSCHALSVFATALSTAMTLSTTRLCGALSGHLPTLLEQTEVLLREGNDEA